MVEHMYIAMSAKIGFGHSPCSPTPQMYVPMESWNHGTGAVAELIVFSYTVMSAGSCLPITWCT